MSKQSRTMRRGLTAAGGALFVFGFASAYADIPAGWSCNGNCGTLGADGVVSLSPSGNSGYEYVTTYLGADGGGQISSVGGTNGSSLTTPSFSAVAGAPLNLYFNYVTSDGAGFADYAWVALTNTATSAVTYLFTARTEPSGSIIPGVGLPATAAGVTLNPSSVSIQGGGTGPVWSALGPSSGLCYSSGCGYTGWDNSIYTIPTAGNYTLTFGVTNWLDQAYDSGLAIDGVTVSGVAIPVGDLAPTGGTTPVTPIVSAVPEPSSVALLGAGLAAGFLGLRRRAKKIA